MQYDSIVRIFLLPKSHTPHTLVVISLDPPIRKGQTFYPHILVQLPTDEDITITLDIEDEQFAEKNAKVSSYCPAWQIRRNLARLQPHLAQLYIDFDLNCLATSTRFSTHEEPEQDVSMFRLILPSSMSGGKICKCIQGSRKSILRLCTSNYRILVACFSDQVFPLVKV